MTQAIDVVMASIHREQYFMVTQSVSVGIGSTLHRPYDAYVERMVVRAAMHSLHTLRKGGRMGQLWTLRG
jgi:hypothetical protein